MRNKMSLEDFKKFIKDNPSYYLSLMTRESLDDDVLWDIFFGENLTNYGTSMIIGDDGYMSGTYSL